jgi:hypothetical protein
MTLMHNDNDDIKSKPKYKPCSNGCNGSIRSCEYVVLSLKAALSYPILRIYYCINFVVELHLGAFLFF